MGALAEAGEGLVEDLGHGEECFEAELFAESFDLSVFGGGSVQEQFGGAAGEGGEAVAEVAEELFSEGAEIDAFGDRGLDFAEGGGSVAIGDAFC